MGNLVGTLIVFQDIINSINENQGTDNTIILFMNNDSMVIGDVFDLEEDNNNLVESNLLARTYQINTQALKEHNKDSDDEAYKYKLDETLLLTNAVIRTSRGQNFHSQGIIINVANITGYTVGSRSEFLQEVN